jgi:osmotically-inducible protein OsmY
MREKMETMAASHTTHIDDETLTQRIHRALEDIKPLCDLGSPLHVQLNDGVVTLRGVVATYLDKARILQAVCNVHGVHKINDKLWV